MDVAQYTSGSTAIDYTYRSAIPQRQTQPQRNFEVLEGIGLDERVRRGVSASHIRVIKIFMSVLALVLVLGVVRISLATATVTAIETTLDLRSEVADAQAATNELRVENSILSSSTRIERIATQNYGMEQASETVTITLDEASDDEQLSDEASNDTDQNDLE